MAGVFACGYFPIVMWLPLSLPHFYGRGTHVPVFPSLQLRFYAKTNQTNYRAGEMAQGIQVIASKPNKLSLILGGLT